MMFLTVLRARVDQLSSIARLLFRAAWMCELGEGVCISVGEVHLVMFIMFLGTYFCSFVLCCFSFFQLFISHFKSTTMSIIVQYAI